ncbi:MAG: hypothetical protein STSR0008_06170 [Ignavibacterium sp.]
MEYLLMKKKTILIDKNIIDFNSTISKGLISGLKKLQSKGFEIFVNDLNYFDNTLLKIFESEGIIITNQNIENPDYFIFAKNSNNKNQNLYKISDDNKILISEDNKIKNFEEAVSFILRKLRSSNINRKTKETNISISICLDGNGKSSIKTGIGFFDHMLEQIARHSNIDLIIDCKGDLNVDEHHTVEDIGIALGTAINEALGDKRGIKRYGFFLPMDDSIARCAIDLSGRSYLNFKCKFVREKVGDFPTELTEEFFKGLSSGMKANIYIQAKGKNEHHKIEAIFKAFAKALNEACTIDVRNENYLPTTKGIL